LNSSESGHRTGDNIVSERKPGKTRQILRGIGRTVPIVIGLIVLVTVIGWMEGFFDSKIQAGVDPGEERLVGNVSTARVTALETTETAEAVGTIQPRQKTEIAARLLSTIQEVLVEPGARVSAGDVLIILDDREIQAQLREVEAARMGVESDLAVRQREFQRYKQMFSEKAVSKEDFDRIEGMFLVTQSQLKRTDEQVSRMNVMLSYAKIIAPREGIITDRFADPGDLAAPGKPLLTMHNPDELELHASVRESLAQDVTPGQKLAVHIDSLNLNLEGTVREIVPQAESLSRSVLVKIALPVDSTVGVYIGMFGRLAIPIGETERVVVQSSAIQRMGQLEVVDVVQDGKLERRFVRSGKRFGDQTEILSGLDVGETVTVVRKGR
jgi:membrane fusion protein, multidrug efflux system